MTPTNSVLTIALTAAAAAAGWGFAQQPKQTTSQPATPAATTAPAPAQYALLSHYELRTFTPYEGGNWRFEEPGATYDGPQLAKAFGFKPGNEQFPAFIVNTIAARGWELVSHTDVATTIPNFDVEGRASAFGSTTNRIEQWWFKKR